MSEDRSLLFYLFMGAFSSVLGSLILETVQARSWDEVPVVAGCIWVLALLLLAKQIKAKAITIAI